MKKNNPPNRNIPSRGQAHRVNPMNQINKELNLKNIFNLQQSKNDISNNNSYFDILDSNNNFISNPGDKKDLRENYFSSDNNFKMSMFTTSNNFNPKANIKNKIK